MNNKDEKFIRRCIELSEIAVANGDAPFGALIEKNGKIIAESSNGAAKRVSDHAEILALHLAHDKLGTSDLTGCTLYSNCEPCPMCSFMAREYKVSRVVFALPSPFMGGHSKWSILADEELAQFEPYFKNPPEIISGVLETDAKKVLDGTPLWMFGSSPRKNEQKDH